MRIIASCIIAVLAVLAPSAAYSAADESYHTPGPSVTFPVYKTPGATETVVQLEASADSWRIRQIARSFDAQIPGLTINTRGNCAVNAHDLCIKTQVAYFTGEEMFSLSNGTSTEWMGIVTFDQVDTKVRTVHLNLRQKSMQYRTITAAHELAHALGLGHHDGRGLMGANLYWNLNPKLHKAELAVLRSWYASN